MKLVKLNEKHLKKFKDLCEYYKSGLNLTTELFIQMNHIEYEDGFVFANFQYSYEADSAIITINDEIYSSIKDINYELDRTAFHEVFEIFLMKHNENIKILDSTAGKNISHDKMESNLDHTFVHSIWGLYEKERKASKKRIS